MNKFDVKIHYVGNTIFINVVDEVGNKVYSSVGMDRSIWTPHRIAILVEDILLGLTQ